LRCGWINDQGEEQPLTMADILVVSPYNMQVDLLRGMLPPGARVGTVDKFQGQEGAVVLISMATSSGEDLPRNIEFLYSRNRLNVAISRARCSAVIFASPRLLEIACSTIPQMQLVNTLCWAKIYADDLEATTGR
jgi:superfamily I DNA and/or RNA helicase